MCAAVIPSRSIRARAEGEGTAVKALENVLTVFMSVANTLNKIKIHAYSEFDAQTSGLATEFSEVDLTRLFSDSDVTHSLIAIASAAGRDGVIVSLHNP